MPLRGCAFVSQTDADFGQYMERTSSSFTLRLGVPSLVSITMSCPVMPMSTLPSPATNKSVMCVSCCDLEVVACFLPGVPCLLKIM